MGAVTIDGQDEGDFRTAIQTQLRNGQADEAAVRLRTLLDGLCGPGRPLPVRFLTIEPGDVVLGGLDQLAPCIAALDRKGTVITAIEIDFSAPEHRCGVPDAQGYLEPHIETSFYCDTEAYPFSRLDRPGLLGCYEPTHGKSLGNAKWQGESEDVDDVVTVGGISGLYGAVFRLTKDASVSDGEQARVLGACCLAVLVHRAVRDCAALRSMKRPMAIIVGSNNYYPFFNAPALAARRHGWLLGNIASGLHAVRTRRFVKAAAKAAAAAAAAKKLKTGLRPG